MKAITLTQPWATLVAIGAKKIETRSWNTNYRGPLVIHAAKGFPKEAQRMCHAAYFTIALDAVGMGQPKNLPIGVVLATCELVKTERIYADSYIPGKPELMFGDYSIGRYMWFLNNVVMFTEPIPAKGALGLWNWEAAATLSGLYNCHVCGLEKCVEPNSICDECLAPPTEFEINQMEN
jgi:activating signal cointegrator 1